MIISSNLFYGYLVYLGGISGGGCMDECFRYMVPKGLKIFFFSVFFLERSSLVERGGAGENVKA